MKSHHFETEKAIVKNLDYDLATRQLAALLRNEQREEYQPYARHILKWIASRLAMPELLSGEIQIIEEVPDDYSPIF